MILSSYINEQLAAGHRRDLLQAADRGRLIAHARQRPDSASAGLRRLAGRGEAGYETVRYKLVARGGPTA